VQTRLLTRAALIPRWLLGALVLVAALLGGAGGATLLLEQRLAAVAAGGLSARILRYNPFTGTLHLEDVRGVPPVAGLAVGAAVVRAHVELSALLAGRVRLSEERTLPGADAGLASGLIEIVHAVEAALAE
jgi:hypothetical protein